jgi:hypothetical protein
MKSLYSYHENDHKEVVYALGLQPMPGDVLPDGEISKLGQSWLKKVKRLTNTVQPYRTHPTEKVIDKYLNVWAEGERLIIDASDITGPQGALYPDGLNLSRARCYDLIPSRKRRYEQAARAITRDGKLAKRLKENPKEADDDLKQALSGILTDRTRYRSASKRRIDEMEGVEENPAKRARLAIYLTHYYSQPATKQEDTVRSMKLREGGTLDPSATKGIIRADKSGVYINDREIFTTRAIHKGYKRIAEKSEPAAYPKFDNYEEGSASGYIFFVVPMGGRWHVYQKVSHYQRDSEEAAKALKNVATWSDYYGRSLQM